MRGRDIKRYSYDFADLWLINAHNGVKDKNIPPIDIDNYPAIKEYLNRYYAQLVQRQDKGDSPYNLRNCVYMDDFSKQKIVYREIGEQMDACLINDEVYINNKCYIITGQNLKQLICYLNSKLFNKLIMCETNLTGGKGIGFISKIKLLPITKSPILDELYGKLFDSADPKKIDAQIDEIIYDLFNLNEAEKDYIRNL